MPARKSDAPRCEDCYFRKKMLCALDLEEPCSTFRADRPEGLVPPRQPRLLLRPPRWAAEQRPTQAVGASAQVVGASTHAVGASTQVVGASAQAPARS